MFQSVVRSAFVRRSNKLAAATVVRVSCVPRTPERGDVNGSKKCFGPCIAPNDLFVIFYRERELELARPHYLPYPINKMHQLPVVKRSLHQNPPAAFWNCYRMCRND
jgi:hypothetical protein